MRYLLLIYSNAETWGHPTFLRSPAALAMSPDERSELVDQFEALMDELVRSGELVGGEALSGPSYARTVRVRGGAPVVTDGPFIETKEQFAGYFVVDCESVERATEIAARLPDARFAAVEVRPLDSTQET